MVPPPMKASKSWTEAARGATMPDSNTLPLLLQIDPHRVESYNSGFRPLRCKSMATRYPTVDPISAAAQASVSDG